MNTNDEQERLESRDGFFTWLIALASSLSVAGAFGRSLELFLVGCLLNLIVGFRSLVSVVTDDVKLRAVSGNSL
jgi:hypothetical protein